jgi:hypothetical protein
MKKDTDLESHKEKLLNFVSEHLCKKTGMYIGRSDFLKLAHFYDGYTMALQTHLEIDLYRGWNYWLADELKPKFRNHVWWNIMLEVYKTDELCIEKFPKLLERYLHSKEFETFVSELDGREKAD